MRGRMVASVLLATALAEVASADEKQGKQGIDALIEEAAAQAIREHGGRAAFDPRVLLIVRPRRVRKPGVPADDRPFLLRQGGRLLPLTRPPPDLALGGDMAVGDAQRD